MTEHIGPGRYAGGRRRAPKPGGLLVLAGVLAVVRVTVPRAPFTVNGQTLTLSQAHAICTSGIGELAQAFSTSAAADCGKIAAGYDALNAVTLAAIACVVWAVVLIFGGRP